MNIIKEQIDSLNAVVKIDILKEDYSEKVSKVLKDYRKNANVPGFRKGNVPFSLIQKQYGKAVLVDEINKLLQDALDKFLTEEKLDVLGNPLPKPQDDLDWDAEQFSFEFELGLAPEFEINLKVGNKVNSYKIVADDATINKQIDNIRKQYGKLEDKDTAGKDTEIKGVFTNDEKNINNETILIFNELVKDAQKKLSGAKIGDKVSLNSKKIFEDAHDLMRHLKVNHDDVHDLDLDVVFEVQDVKLREAAELNQEFFDKIFGEGKVSSETEMINTLREDFEQQFGQQSDQKLLNDVTEFLIENTQFDLPQTFLQKWIQTVGEKPLTAEEAAAEYQKSEKALRYQLIESKLIRDNNLQVTYEDLKNKAKELIVQQMVQFGNTNIDETELDNIANRILSNREEAKRLSDQILSLKQIQFFKENIDLKEKEVSYDEFIKELYG
ncbi:MAG: trigger factor [Flavobacteriaceae bacterium]|nr:trigger factor [Flavobacteriaceae bacterium]MDZ4147484.1 trigger factor [Flavobacteriaceae bacterium]